METKPFIATTIIAVIINAAVSVFAAYQNVARFDMLSLTAVLTVVMIAVVAGKYLPEEKPDYAALRFIFGSAFLAAFCASADYAEMDEARSIAALAGAAFIMYAMIPSEGLRVPRVWAEILRILMVAYIVPLHLPFSVPATALIAVIGCFAIGLAGDMLKRMIAEDASSTQ